MSDQNPGLWTPENKTISPSPMEKQTLQTLMELNALNPFDPGQRMISQVCLSLARNIDAGNTKGRAIANEAAQLLASLQTLQGDDLAPTDQLPPEIRTLLAAFASTPALDPAAPMHAEEL